MFQTLGYFLELTVSIYFFCVVILFMINVCEFMPLNSHEAREEEKILIRTPSSPRAPDSKSALSVAQDAKSKAARERWKSLPKKLPKSNSWDKVLSDPRLKDLNKQGELAPPHGENVPPEEPAQPEAKTEQSPEAPAGNQEAQETPADDSPTVAPIDDPAAAPAADDGSTAAPADDGAAPAEPIEAKEDADATGPS